MFEKQKTYLVAFLVINYIYIVYMLAYSVSLYKSQSANILVDSDIFQLPIATMLVRIGT
jgi:hypothetical protein